MDLRPGMTFTIEPMINTGKYDVKMLNDGGLLLQKINLYQHNLSIH